MEKNKTLFLKNAAVKKSHVVMDKVTVTWTLNVKGIWNVETITVVLPFLIQEQIAANKESVNKRAWIWDNFLNFTNRKCKLRIIVFQNCLDYPCIFCILQFNHKIMLKPQISSSIDCVDMQLLMSLVSFDNKIPFNWRWLYSISYIIHTNYPSLIHHKKLIDSYLHNSLK